MFFVNGNSKHLRKFMESSVQTMNMIVEYLRSVANYVDNMCELYFTFVSDTDVPCYYVKWKISSINPLYKRARTCWPFFSNFSREENVAGLSCIYHLCHLYVHNISDFDQVKWPRPWTHRLFQLIDCEDRFCAYYSFPLQK